ncbi:hypothetical protein GCM10022224_054450 [Nonomuraea antimicrobica]|uniref:Uncharacterized protein n=1 Tax=Nonomuraea antimicrobica TaxID=561173 RepID=A0ABP7CCU4_9ACTN
MDAPQHLDVPWDPQAPQGRGTPRTPDVPVHLRAPGAFAKARTFTQHRHAPYVTKETPYVMK